MTRAQVKGDGFEVVTRVDFGASSKEDFLNLAKEKKADVSLFQWTPLAFGPKSYGIILGLGLVLRALGQLEGHRVHLMVHESHYPVLLNPRGLLIGLPHFLQFLFFMLFCHRLSFSHMGTLKKWQKWAPKRLRPYMNVLPVFSNISLRSSDQLHSEASNKDSYQLVYFGGQHPTNDLTSVRKAFDHCQKELGPDNVTLKVVGIRPKDCPAIFKGEGIEVLGHLEESKVSQVLLESDLLCVPFTDGVSTRRGTVMAGLEHGLAVLSTDSYNTLDDIPWRDFLALSGANNPTSYGERALSLLRDGVGRNDLAKKGQDFYRSHFSCKVAVKALTTLYS